MIIELLEVGGLYPVMRAMRHAKKSYNSSDSTWGHAFSNKDNLTFDYPNNDDTSHHIGLKDQNLAKNLILAGDDHAKCMRGLLTWIEITADGHFFDQWNSYRIGVEPLGSTSTMHIENKDLYGEALSEERRKNFGSYEYTRSYIVGYQAWRHIYFARKSHRMPEWMNIIAFIEKLPLADQFITIKKELIDYER